MARYQGKRLDRTRSGSAARRKPQRLQGDAAVSERPAPHRLPVVRLLLLAVILTGVAMLSGTAARYWKEWSSSSLVTAKNFYFTSGELKGSVYRLTATAEGRVEFPFTLRNYIVAEYPTQSEISYTCQVINSAGTAVADARWFNSDSTVAGTGTLSDSLTGGPPGADRELTCSIPAEAFGADGRDVLTLSVAATKPYTATLTAKLALAAGDGGVKLIVTDLAGRNNAVSVSLYNTSGQPCKGTLSWPTEDLKLAPDLTWEIPVEPDNTLTIPASGAVSVVFLKKNTEDTFSESDFRFTISE